MSRRPRETKGSREGPKEVIGNKFDNHRPLRSVVKSPTAQYLI